MIQRDERLEQLRELLDREGFLTVEELSRRFYISLPTAYRDLRELENQKLIIRGQGGAMPVAAEKANLPLDLRKTINAAAKDRIGRRAAELLQPGSVIFLDASTTAASMIAHMRTDLNLTVLTNSLDTAMRLKQAGHRTYCVGGSLIGNSVAVGGKLASDVTDHFHIDLLFFSSYGVDSHGMIIDTEDMERTLRRHLLHKPITSVFLCDATKFGKSAVFRIASIEMVDYVVSDAPLPPDFPSPRRDILLG